MDKRTVFAPYVDDIGDLIHYDADLTVLVGSEDPWSPEDEAVLKVHVQTEAGCSDVYMTVRLGGEENIDTIIQALTRAKDEIRRRRTIRETGR